MLLPEFCEELFYVKKINLFESTFKIYLQKVDKYNILETQKWLKRINFDYTVQQLKKLQILNLYNNQLTTIPISNLNLPNLQQLSFTDNQLTSIPNLNLPNLEILHLSFNKLTSIPNLNLPNLQRLYLYNNQLTSIPNLNLPDLQRFYLNNNQLTSIPTLSLSNLPDLQDLELSNNPLSETEKARLKSIYGKKIII